MRPFVCMLVAVALFLAATPSGGADSGRPRFTIIEDFRSSLNPFGGDDVMNTVFDGRYKAMKKLFETKGWIVNVQRDLSGNKILAEAQRSDVLLIISHGNIIEKPKEAPHSFIRLYRPRIFKDKDDEVAEYRLEAERISKVLEGKNGPKLTIVRACLQGRHSDLASAFGGAYHSYLDFVRPECVEDLVPFFNAYLGYIETDRPGASADWIEQAKKAFRDYATLLSQKGIRAWKSGIDGQPSLYTTTRRQAGGPAPAAAEQYCPIDPKPGQEPCDRRAPAPK